MYKQYKVGRDWEREVMDWYFRKGYFVYKMPTMNSGTVFDILVIKNGAAMCIECKHIKGDKLYYENCGLKKKRDEIEHFIKRTNNNVYICVKSDTTGTWWTTWGLAKKMFEKQGYLTRENCFKASMEDVLNNAHKE